MKLSFPRPGNWFFILPWIAFIPWYGMLIAMLICWGVQGRPIYDFMDDYMSPVYISDIGATNLRPLFIACSAWQGLGYCLTILTHWFQRYKFYMPPWYTKDERNLIIASCILGIIGELGLLFCTIFSTKNYPHVHTAMVCVFVVLLFFSVVCLFTQDLIMGKHYAIIHPRSDVRLTFDQLKWNQWEGYVWNKYVISAIFKAIWLVLAVVWAICFGACKDKSRSSDFEWLLAFWFGILFIIISVDFYLGGRYKQSKFFKSIDIDSFSGYYKFEEMVNRKNLNNQVNDLNFVDSNSTIEPKDIDEDHSTSSPTMP